MPDRDGRLLLAVLALATILRLYHVTAPYVDLSAWRSLDYASMARNFYEVSYKLWLPRADWAGPDGIIESELPILPWLVAVLYPVAGVHDWLGRLLTLTCGVMGIAYLFMLVRRLLGRDVALLSALVLAINPMHLYFSRTFQPDVPMMAAATAALYHFDRYLAGARRHGVATVLVVALAGCLKLSALFIGLPMLVLVVVRRGWRGILDPRLWLIGVSGLLPVAGWYIHARQLFLTHGHTVGILSGGHDKLQTLTYLSMPWWWRVMATERTWGWILTPAGVLLFLVGLHALLRAWSGKGEATIERGNILVAGTWLGTGCLFVLIVAEGNLDMPHYQLMVTVPAAMVTGLGLHRLAVWLARRRVSPAWTAGLAMVALLGGTAWTLRHAYDNKRAGEVELATALNAFMPPGGLFVNPGAYTTHKGGYDYEPMVFYYAHRKGWVLTPDMFNPDSLESFVQRGATHLATYHVDVVENAPAFADYLKRHHEVLRWDAGGIILHLRTPMEER